MTFHYVSASVVGTGNALQLSTGDTMYLPSNLRLVSTDDWAGISAAQGEIGTAIIYGSVVGGAGIDAEGGENSIDIRASGSVAGTDVGIWITGSNNVIRNAGDITGRSCAIQIAGGGNTIVNSGQISSDQSYTIQMSGANHITNTGNIQGVGTAVYVFSATTNEVDNSGTICGGTSVPAIEIVGGTATIRNSGQILGSVEFYGCTISTYNGTLGSVAAVVTTGGSNTLYGGTDAETFYLLGTSTTFDVDGGGGNDAIHVGSLAGYTGAGALTSADTIDGGAGTDTLEFYADCSAGVTFSADMMANIEILKLDDGYNYKLTTVDANVASGKVLTVKASALSSTHKLVFDGSAETNGTFAITGSAGADTLTGGAGADTINGSGGNDLISGGAGNDVLMSSTGNDTLLGGAGDDTFKPGANLTAADKIDGGAGNDVLVLGGDYTGAHALTLNSSTVVNIETIKLASGYGCSLTTNNATVASGKTLTIDASALSSTKVLTFDGSAETNGHFNLTGGNAGDVITLGSLSDTFVYTSVSQSTSTKYDTITGWNFAADTFDIAGSVTAIDTSVTTGALSAASFDANLATALSGKLAAHHAVLFKPTTGDLSGAKFLVIDMNGTAGYQSGHDLVIRLIASTGTLAVGGFV